MKWFKHFSDNHRGRSMQHLFDSMGHVGAYSYYILVEICAEKLEQKQDKTLENSDCLFEFHERIVRHSLRISPTNLRRLLDICQTFGLLSFEFSGNSLKISMPILLDLLDYDHKKSRARRARITTENRLEKNREEKNRTDKLLRSTKSEIQASEKPKKTNVFIAEYCSRFKIRYGSNPVVTKKEAGIAKRLAELLSEERALIYLDAFFQMPDADLVKSKHPLSKFEFKLNEITVFADSGKFTPRAQASDVDRELADGLKKQKNNDELLRLLEEKEKQYSLLEMNK